MNDLISRSALLKRVRNSREDNPFRDKTQNLIWHNTHSHIISIIEQLHNIEGLVFWKDGEPQCKIKRSDFGFEWPVKASEVHNENA